MLGVLYGVISAACFGFNNASARRGALSGTAVQGLATSMVAGTVLFVATAAAFGEWGDLSRMDLADVALLSAAGLAHFVWGRYFNIKSLAAVGSNLAGPVQQFQLLLSLTLAIVFLGESLTPLKVVGILLVVAAPAYILERRAKAMRRARAAPAPQAVGADVTASAPESKFKPRMVEGYTYALLAGLGFGSSSVLAKAGMSSTDAPFAGGLVSYLAASIVVGLVLMVPGKFAEVRTMKGESRKWFMFSGLAVSLSQMFRYLALSVAPVTVVQPLQSLSLMFRMLFGYILNREHEAFDRYVIVGLALSFAGALALSVSDEILLRHVTLPDWLEELSRWKWP